MAASIGKTMANSKAKNDHCKTHAKHRAKQRTNFCKHNASQPWSLLTLPPMELVRDAHLDVDILLPQLQQRNLCCRQRPTVLLQARPATVWAKSGNPHRIGMPAVAAIFIGALFQFVLKKLHLWCTFCTFPCFFIGALFFFGLLPSQNQRLPSRNQRLRRCFELELR